MSNEDWNAGYNAGMKAARAELVPLAEAIMDAALMFQDIENARNLPAFADVRAQYVAAGKQLQRLFTVSGLNGLVP